MKIVRSINGVPTIVDIAEPNVDTNDCTSNLLNELKLLELNYIGNREERAKISQEDKTFNMVKANIIRDELRRRGYFIIEGVIKGDNTWHVMGIVKHENIEHFVPDNASCDNCLIYCSEGSLTGGRVKQARCCSAWIPAE